MRVSEPKALPALYNATFEQWYENVTKEPKYTIMSFDPKIWERDDVLASMVLYGGMGGVTKGSLIKRDGKFVITALVIEADAEVCETHRLNNPSAPVLQMHMVSHGEVLKAARAYLPKRHWGRTWIHASNSCKKASASNMHGRDISAARADTVWVIALLKMFKCAIWTLENVESLHQYFKGQYPTCYIFSLRQHCKLAQERKRLIISNRPLFLPRVNEELTVREVLGNKKGWDANKTYWMRNPWGCVRSVDQAGYTVTSGYLQAGAEAIGDFGVEHILDSEDRALLQGFGQAPLWSARVPEHRRRAMVAQCVPPPFALKLSEAAFEYQSLALEHLRVEAKLVVINDTPEDELKQVVRAGIALPADWLSKLDVDRARVAKASTMREPPDLASSGKGGHKGTPVDHTSNQFKFGKHGRWRNHGKYGWAKATIPIAEHIALMTECPWLICEHPPDPGETHASFHTRREREKLVLTRQLLEQAGMSENDRLPNKRADSAAAKLSRHFTNIHAAPDGLAKRDSNRELQERSPEWYGPFLPEGQSYTTPRTKENLEAAYEAVGLNNLDVEDKDERGFYVDLIYDLWVLFDDKLRAIVGVEIDLNLDNVKPLRAHPYRWSPAKVAAGKKLIQEFMDDGILKPITSEWASPALLVPKPKGGWRLVVDLRELNKLIPQDSYEPPGCDLCLEWLTGRPYRSTADMRWGFHQVLLSERTQKIFTLVTPFGTFGYTRLVMGYINATAEFQRHMNNTLGPSLWDMCLSMVDDVCVASATKPEHRLHMTSVLTKLAQRNHSIKPSKMAILRKIVEYLGHMSTPQGTKPTGKHVSAIVEMPAPINEDGPDMGKVNKTSLRSFIGLAKYVRRYIRNCGRLCTPLNDLLCDDSDGIWRAIHEMVYNRIKMDIANTQGVWHPDYKEPLYISCDGSKRGIGGYLYQLKSGVERVITYFSRATTKDERKWDTRELEVLALISTLEYFRHYIEGQKVYVSTDHKNITWLSKLKGTTGRLGRWVLRLAEFQAEVSWRKGKHMHVADCLSRNSVRSTKDEEDAEDTEVPVTCAFPEMMVRELNPNDGGGTDKFGQVTGSVYELTFSLPEPHEVEAETKHMIEKDLHERDIRLRMETSNAGAASTAQADTTMEQCMATCSSEGEFLDTYADVRALELTNEGAPVSVAEGGDAKSSVGGGAFEFFGPQYEQLAEKLWGSSGAVAQTFSSGEGAATAETAAADALMSSTARQRDERDDTTSSTVFDVQPFQIPEALTPSSLQFDNFRLEQQKDPFAKELMDRLSRLEAGDTIRDERAKKFAMLDGVLHRVTEADDPREGYDSVRIYVPPSLRAQVMRNHHSSVWGAHQNATSTYKTAAVQYYWPKMEVAVQKFVKECRQCELAKGVKPTRQGFMHGWKHSQVHQMVTMDLIGPIGAPQSGKRGKMPHYILVITDPFSHMLWLEPLASKNAEEVYERFVNGFLLEEGAPRFILTDRGAEFDNAILKDTMRLLNVRLGMTPAYHPRGNYTERVNRFVGESLRTMLSSRGADKHDWYKLLKFVQFVYRRMFIPGTNLSPYMVARGRQPSLPSDLERRMMGDSVPPPASLNQHVKELNSNMELAAKLLQAAREQQLAKSRERFNQDQIEVRLQPGERVRLWKRVPIRHGADDTEVASKLKIFNTVHVVVKSLGDSCTRYLIRNEVTGKETEAHISQIARMRAPLAQDHETEITPVDGDVYDRLAVGSFALIWRRCDAKSVLRVVEVIAVDRDTQEFTGWFNVHGGSVRSGGYVHERPLVQMRLVPEWLQESTGDCIVKPSAAMKRHCVKITGHFNTVDTVVIASGFQLQSGGKMHPNIMDKADAWLRKQAAEEPRCVLALSNPNAKEKTAATRIQ